MKNHSIVAKQEQPNRKGGIFEPHRAIGCITTSVPFSIQRLGTETFVTVSVGKAFQIFNCAKLTLLLAGNNILGFPPFLIISIFGPIKMSNFRFRSFTAEEDYCSCLVPWLHFCCIWNQHWSFQARASGSFDARCKLAVFFFVILGAFEEIFNTCWIFQVATWSSHSAKVKLLLVFGDHVISVGADGNMFLWAFKGNEESNVVPFKHIKLDEKFSPSCIMHPDTYINKVKTKRLIVFSSVH